MQTFSIDKKPTPFNQYQITFVALIILNGIAWGIPQTVIDALVLNQTAWHDLYQTSTARSTKGVGATANRNRYLPTFYDAITNVMVKYLITNTSALITAANKLSLNIKTKTAIPSSVVTPTTTPVVQVIIKESLAHHFTLLDSGTGKKRRPKGVVFAEFKYIVAAAAPASVDDCTKNIFIAGLDNFVVFDAGDKNKNAYYFARWITKKGQMGPYTLIFSAVIA